MSEPASERPSWRWRVSFGGLLALTMGVGPLVPYILSALAPAIIRDLGLTRTQLGLLATIAFAVGAAGSSSSGGLSDRLGTRRMLFMLHGVSGLAIIWLAVAPSFVWLTLAMVLAGLSLASSNPVTNLMIGQQVVPGNRGVLLGVKQSGVQMSQFVAGALLPTLAVFVGWRGATWASLVFIAMGLTGTWALVPERATVPAASLRPRGESVAMVRWFAVYGLLVGIVIQGVNVYLPLYSFEVLGFTEQQAGAVAGFIGAVGVGARILWGRSAERCRTAVAPMLVIAAASTAAVAVIWASGSVSPAWLWAGAGLFAGTTLAGTVVLMMAIVRGVASDRTGKASGQVMRGVYSGFMIGPVAFGALVDATDDYAVGWWALLACALAATVVCLIYWRRAVAEDPCTSGG